MRIANGYGEWIEVDALGPERSVREHEREMWALRAKCAGLELHEYLHRNRVGYTATALVRRLVDGADEVWRNAARAAIRGYSAAGEPPRWLCKVVDDHDPAGDCDGIDGAQWLVTALRNAGERTGMDHDEYSRCQLALRFAESYRSACERVEREPTPREAARVVLDAWPLGDRGAGDLWWREMQRAPTG